MTAPAWDFAFLVSLSCRPAGQGRVFATGRGKGPVFLFIHAGFHGAWCWADYLRYFQDQGVAAAAIDLRGHGGLPQSENFIAQGVRDVTADVVAATKILGGPVVLAGPSLGALVAMTTAEHVNIDGLILLAPSPPNDIPGMHALPPVPGDRVVPPPSDERTRKWFLPGYSGSDISRFLARLCPESPALLNDRYQMRVSADAKWVKGPTLCVSAGLDDNALHPAGQDEAIAKYFGAAYQVLPGAGHCLMADDSWRLGADAILGWLRRHGLAGSLV